MDPYLEFTTPDWAYSIPQDLSGLPPDLQPPDFSTFSGTHQAVSLASQLNADRFIQQQAAAKRQASQMSTTQKSQPSKKSTQQQPPAAKPQTKSHAGPVVSGLSERWKNLSHGGTGLIIFREKQLSKMKLPEIKELLKQQGLSRTGNKADLIARLLNTSATGASPTIQTPLSIPPSSTKLKTTKKSPKAPSAGLSKSNSGAMPKVKSPPSASRTKSQPIIPPTKRVKIDYDQSFDYSDDSNSRFSDDLYPKRFETVDRFDESNASLTPLDPSSPAGRMMSQPSVIWMEICRWLPWEDILSILGRLNKDYNKMVWNQIDDIWKKRSVLTPDITVRPLNPKIQWAQIFSGTVHLSRIISNYSTMDDGSVDVIGEEIVLRGEVPHFVWPIEFRLLAREILSGTREESEDGLFSLFELTTLNHIDRGMLKKQPLIVSPSRYIVDVKYVQQFSSGVKWEGRHCGMVMTGIYCDVKSPLYGHVLVINEYVDEERYPDVPDCDLDDMVDGYHVEDWGTLDEWLKRAVPVIMRDNCPKYRFFPCFLIFCQMMFAKKWFVIQKEMQRITAYPRCSPIKNVSSGISMHQWRRGCSRGVADTTLPYRNRIASNEWKRMFLQNSSTQSALISRWSRMNPIRRQISNTPLWVSVRTSSSEDIPPYLLSTDTEEDYNYLLEHFYLRPNSQVIVPVFLYFLFFTQDPWYRRSSISEFFSRGMRSYPHRVADWIEDIIDTIEYYGDDIAAEETPVFRLSHTPNMVMDRTLRLEYFFSCLHTLMDVPEVMDCISKMKDREDTSELVHQHIEEMLKKEDQVGSELNVRIPVEYIIGTGSYLTNDSIRSYINTLWSDYFYTGENKILSHLLDSLDIEPYQTKDEELARELIDYGWKSLKHHAQRHASIHQFLMNRKMKKERLNQIVDSMEEKKREGRYVYDGEEKREYSILPMDGRVSILSSREVVTDNDPHMIRANASLEGNEGPIDMKRFHEKVNHIWKTRNEGQRSREKDKEVIECIQIINRNKPQFEETCERACMAAAILFLGSKMNLNQAMLHDPHHLLRCEGRNRSALHLADHWFNVALDLSSDASEVLFQYTSFLYHVQDYKKCAALSDRAIRMGYNRAYKVNILALYHDGQIEAAREKYRMWEEAEDSGGDDEMPFIGGIIHSMDTAQGKNMLREINP
ncbi:hypothetical protein PROFUN_11922 [Planoprotostelium fungivorum]|uniref:SAP domain-containing protein n=1 Tax=Planoprotostelium fungivorum TaxID=1890364 RepID=A0A2P6N8S3_9EUKA|nr:hypothetical protein PROFUN_11922 [Planoprotostelium fungivorum]